MLRENFIPAHVRTRYQRTSYMSHDFENICNFEIQGGDYSESIRVFNKEYIASRKQLFKDMKLGKWKEENDIGYQNYLKVLESGEWKLGYYENEFNYRVPAQIKCCNKWLSLDSFTNTCKHCNTDYSGSGELLAPRHFWGEETGAYWSGCL
tara:strand:- start:565 stop:1017 length:453 start_codon:yes stop_codon:yes gene_type:complete